MKPENVEQYHLRLTIAGEVRGISKLGSLTVSVPDSRTAEKKRPEKLKGERESGKISEHTLTTKRSSFALAHNHFFWFGQIE